MTFSWPSAPWYSEIDLKASLVARAILAVAVSLRVYDVTGREVARLVEAPMAAGSHRVTFDASGLSSGMYLYRIQAGRFTQVRRMVVVK